VARREHLIALVALSLPGCGEDRSSGAPDQREVSGKAGPTPTARTDSSRAVQSNNSRPPPSQAPIRSSHPGPRGPGSRVITTRSGVVVVTPPRPRPTRSRPGSRCGRIVIERPGTTRTAYLPPKPGIRARRVSREAVQVSWRFLTLPRACRPTHLRLIVDVSNDILPGRQTVVPIRRSKGVTRLSIPRDLAGADSIHAVAVSRERLPAPNVSVAIQQ
jgi:hypothetical protein